MINYIYRAVTLLFYILLYAILHFLVSLTKTTNVNIAKIISNTISSLMCFPKVILEYSYIYNATVIVNNDIIIATVFFPFLMGNLFVDDHLLWSSFFAHPCVRFGRRERRNEI